MSILSLALDEARKNKEFVSRISKAYGTDNVTETLSRLTQKQEPVIDSVVEVESKNEVTTAQMQLDSIINGLKAIISDAAGKDTEVFRDAIGNSLDVLFANELPNFMEVISKNLNPQDKDMTTKVLNWLSNHTKGFIDETVKANTNLKTLENDFSDICTKIINNVYSAFNVNLKDEDEQIVETNSIEPASEENQTQEEEQIVETNSIEPASEENQTQEEEQTVETNSIEPASEENQTQEEEQTVEISSVDISISAAKEIVNPIIKERGDGKVEVDFNALVTPPSAPDPVRKTTPLQQQQHKKSEKKKATPSPVVQTNHVCTDPNCSHDHSNNDSINWPSNIMAYFDISSLNSITDENMRKAIGNRIARAFDNLDTCEELCQYAGDAPGNPFDFAIGSVKNENEFMLITDRIINNRYKKLIFTFFNGGATIHAI